VGGGGGGVGVGGGCLGVGRKVWGVGGLLVIESGWHILVLAISGYPSFFLRLVFFLRIILGAKLDKKMYHEFPWRFMKNRTIVF